MRGFAVAALKLLKVSVLDCPAKIVAGENEQVKLPGQVNVMAPENELGAAAEIGNVVEVAPTTMVDFDAEDANVNSATPVPDRGTICGLPLALSAMDKFPLRAPLAVGWKTTFTVQLSPTLRRFNKAPQVSVSTKSPLVLILEIDSVCVPVLVIVTVCAELTVPTVWFPNVMLLGVMVTCVAEVTPEPERAIM